MSDSKTVELRPLAIVDLNMKYARKMSENKIRHYTVPVMQLLTQNFIGQDVVKVVEDHIKNEEGQDVNVVLLPSVIPKGPKESPGLVISDVSDKVLKNLPKVRKQLQKLTIKSQIYQYAEVASPEVYRQANRKMTFTEGLAYLASKIGLSRLVPSKYWVRMMNPASYLSYFYEEPDEDKAIAALSSDLAILSKRGLIQGHLSMPFTMYLADTVGSGKAVKAIACFVFADLNKLYRQEGINILDAAKKYSGKPLNGILGIKSECFEGEMGPDLSNAKYDIEYITIGSNTDQNMAAVADNFLATRDAINDHAKKMNPFIENMEKVESQSVTVGEMVEGYPVYHDINGEVLAEPKQAEQTFKATSVNVSVKMNKK